MQVARRAFFLKTDGLSTVTKNTSCSRGWLRLVVQTVFAVITVASFILIVIMAMQSNSPPKPIEPPRCHPTNCRIRCLDAPYYDKYNEDIANALSYLEMSCKRIFLELINPKFENGTLPANWLSTFRGNINGLAIKRGNLNHIPPDAFMNQFMGNIRVIILHHLTLKTWTADSFVGLSNLEELSIDDCYLQNLQNDTLRAVEDTLKVLTITRSDYWNPAYIIGSTHLEKLSKVDFSFNYFGDVIGADTFTGLTNCRVLYLNSCKITAIGPGAFDNLHNIEIIYLSSNFLVHIPPGLFNNIMLNEPKPRINLQDNLWHCDCSNTDLTLLVDESMLIVDPVCVSPVDIQGVTFTDFNHLCSNRTNSATEYSIEKVEIQVTNNYEEDYVYVNGSCQNDEAATEYKSFRVIHPIHTNKCSARGISDLDYSLLHNSVSNINTETKSVWFKISFYLRTEEYSVVQVDSSEPDGYGLLWYQSECPDVIYCINIFPKFLRMFNIDVNYVYTFCPVKLNTGYVEIENCVGYDITAVEDTYSQFQYLLYILIALFCSLLGATFVYTLIRRNPYLLKGSKRILFVKRKSFDALVLPPKVPLRTMNDISISTIDNSIAITLARDIKPVTPVMLHSQKSIRSNKSNAPSYVSALQPTEDQLAEWRIRHHFNNDLTVSSTSSEPSLSSSTPNQDSSLYYYSLETTTSYGQYETSQ